MPSRPLIKKVNDPLLLHREFNMLDLTDLLAARDKNHFDLMRRKNVVGTAVGSYLIRRSDPWPPKLPPKKRGARTLANSEVRPYSWPCVLVFVRKWEDEKVMAPDELVPLSLYLEDNRTVPVCIVEAPPVLTALPITKRVLFPTYRMGGGFPVVAEVQGEEHIASIGCLLTDGHSTYALTNRHVTGDPGEVVYTKAGGELVRIGVSSQKQLTRMPFTEVYPRWHGQNMYLHLDVGLIRLDDVTHWSAQIFGVGAMGEIADLGMDNISLRLIDTPVRAYGCASGKMEGAIKALFYRYRAVGGFDYVADFLIGASDERHSFSTHPGDSGTLWLIDGKAEVPQPIAVQWGGQLFASASGAQESCALATCLSTVCNLLDVDIIRDWNIGGPEYWGEQGHYTIGALACTLLFTGLPGLQKLMSNNLDRVGFTVQDLKKNEKVLRSQAKYSFVPLADVADDVWRNTRKSDSNNHFADMDQPAVTGPYKGKTLLDLCKNPNNVDPQVWLDFYKAVPGTNPGSLPFRVWQIYDEMVAYAKSGDAAHFLAAAGCLAHYVGDACQPLHISRLHHGYPPLKKGSVAYAVHSVYETQMLNVNAPEIVDGVASRVSKKSVTSTFSGGAGAARRVVALMQATVNTLPPSDIVDTYNKAKTPADRLNSLWKSFGEKTMDLMAGGCTCLGDIWASAWKEGNGEQIATSKLGPVDEMLLESYYNNSSFLPSVSLAQLVGVLKSSSVPGGTSTQSAAPKAKKGRLPKPPKPAKRRKASRPSKAGRKKAA